MRADTLILGTRKGLFVMGRSGSGWELRSHSHLGIPVSYADLDPRTGVLWACLDHGHWGAKLARSADLGETWEEAAAPTYPEGEEVKDGVPATTEYLWVLQPGPADQPQRIYLGTNPGGLFVSDDGGESWALNRGLWDHPTRKEQWFGGGRDTPGVHSVIVDPRDSAHLHVGVSCGGVWESQDAGATWLSRNIGLRADFLPPDAKDAVGHDPHCMVASATSPDRLWQQNHCGVFRSDDGAANWEYVGHDGAGPVHFGFPIAVADDDPDTAWVVPGVSDEQRMAVDGILRVCRTTDGGRSWQDQREGLPGSLAYDVVFRHALAQSGDALAFGSTTGNVFHSDNRGDSWERVGSHLPPIYSVRLATTA